MKRTVRHILLVGLLGVLVAACGTRPDPVAGPGIKSSIETRKAYAQKLSRQGKLMEALNQWKVLHAVAPNDRDVERMLGATKRKAKKLASMHFKKAESEIAKRRFNNARAQYIKVLAYDPDHKLAKKRLLNFELVRNRRSRPRFSYKPHQ